MKALLLASSFLCMTLSMPVFAQEADIFCRLPELPAGHLEGVTFHSSLSYHARLHERTSGSARLSHFVPQGPL